MNFFLYENPKIIYKEKLIIVKGKNEINDTMTISPGVTVQFDKITLMRFLFPSYINGQLVITSGKLIAKGTADNPIVFERISNEIGDDPGIIFESGASDESILEYCEFKEEVKVSISNSMTVQYCKFNSDYIYIKLNGDTSFKYNTLRNGIGIGIENGTPVVCFNDIDSNNSSMNFIGIYICGSATSIIENNNIINTSYAAINNVSNIKPYVVTSNYIANCYGKTGVDTTGNQCDNVTYINPRTIPVPDAGCGW